MSKESYARGFCKEAASYGVDPVQLAKFAQEFKTNGYAPPAVVRLGRQHPITFAPGFIETGSYAFDVGPWAKAEAARFDEYEPDHPSQLSADFVPKNFPEVRNWLLAHQKARQAVADAARPYEGDDSPYRDSKMPDLGKIYHDSLLNSTGATSRVSAPAKK